MKRFISVLLVALLLICAVATAEAPDYASMTDEELNTILEAVQVELDSRASADAETGGMVPAEGTIVADEGAVLIDQDGVQLTLTGDNAVHGVGLWMGAIVTNNSDVDVSVIIDNASINGWEVSGLATFNTSSGNKQKDNIVFELNDSGVTSLEDIEELYIEFYLVDADEYVKISDNIPVTIVFPD